MTGHAPGTPFPDCGDNLIPASPVELLQQHPASAKAKPKRPLDYVLVHKPPSYLLPPKVDPKNRETPDYREYFARLCADVKENGVLQPIIAVERGDMAEVVDGETRRRASLHYGGLEAVPILLCKRDLSEADLAIVQLTANSHRRDFTDLELASIFASLLRQTGWSQAELARHIHKSQGQVSRILSISSRLCEAAQAMVAASEIPPRAAYAISKIPDHAVQIDLAEAVKSGALCVEGVEARIAKLNGKGQKKPKSLKVSHGGVTAVVRGNPLEALKSFVAKVNEAIKRIERDNLPPEFLGGLIR